MKVIRTILTYVSSSVVFCLYVFLAKDTESMIQVYGALMASVGTLFGLLAGPVIFHLMKTSERLGSQQEES